MDTIWIDNEWASPGIVSATNTYLRFKLHVEPFIKKSLVEGTWTEKEIVGWGKIYVKVPSAKNN